MSIVLRLKRVMGLSDLEITLPWEKWRTHKTLFWLANTKVYSLLHFLVVARKREIAYENWVDRVYLTKRNRRKRAETNLELSFTFSIVVPTCASSWVRPPEFASGSETHSRNSPQNGGSNFRLSSHRRVRFKLTVFTSSRPAANSLLSPNPASTALWCFHLSSLQPIRTRCQSVVDMFLF